MKVNGKVLDTLRVVKVYLPIANNEAVEFQFRPLRSDEDFEKVMPRPKPKLIRKPGGGDIFDTENPRYKQMIDEWAKKKLDWEFLTSISQTDGIEWDTVKLDNPETWSNWRTELQKTFPDSHINKIFQGFIDAQYITDEMMEKARNLFSQRTLQVSNEPASDLTLKDELQTTQCGEPVSV